MTRAKYIYLSAFLIFLCCFSFLIATKINLVTADLGRHIENGRIIFQGSGQDIKALFHTNFYSYTYPTFPFINHHWGIGVIFYLMWLWFGFKGLSLFYIGCALVAFGISFALATKKSNAALAFVVAMALMPLLTGRREVRPEIITYLLSLVFYAALWLYATGKLKKHWLWLLVILEILWVNIHIGFFFGELIVGLFFLRELLRTKRNWKEIKFFGILLGATVLSTLINPNILAGALYPLSIFKNYGYELYENQTIFKLEQLGFFQPEFAIYKIMLLLTWLFAAIHVIKNKAWSFLCEPLTLLTLTASILSLSAERHLIIFAFFALPFFSLVLGKLFTNMHLALKYSMVIIATLVVIIGTTQTVKARGASQGIGLYEGIENSAVFFLTNNISGPIFNNYDNGSYIEFELKGKEKIYVDNRPEAYPASFFADEYMKAQTDDATWKIVTERYNINVIWFHRNDLTPWGQTFLNSRVEDAQWALVYLDDFSVMFLKRIEKNKELIKKHEIKLD